MNMKKEKRTIPCYLRTHRLVWGLTTKELASLMGFKNATHMSRIENSKRGPKLEVALACQVIFGVPPSAMFPDVYTQVEDRVMWNISQLHLSLQNTTRLAGLRKRELCEIALKRATGAQAQLEGI